MALSVLLLKAVAAKKKKKKKKQKKQRGPAKRTRAAFGEALSDFAKELKEAGSSGSAATDLARKQFQRRRK